MRKKSKSHEAHTHTRNLLCSIKFCSCLAHSFFFVLFLEFVIIISLFFYVIQVIIMRNNSGINWCAKFQDRERPAIFNIMIALATTLCVYIYTFKFKYTVKPWTLKIIIMHNNLFIDSLRYSRLVLFFSGRSIFHFDVLPCDLFFKFQVDFLFAFLLPSINFIVSI